MKIVGIDPGFASLGWVICELDKSSKLTLIDGNVISTKPTDKKRRMRAVDDNLRRVREQARALVKLFDGASLVCLEAFTLGQKGNRSNAAKQGSATAAVVTVCEVLHLPLLQATPQEIKKTTCDTMKASKDEVCEALTKMQPVLAVVLAKLAKGKREHCADALGAVVACLDTEEARLCLAVSGNSTNPR